MKRRLSFPMTMRFKLIASFSAVLLIFLAVALFNLHQMNQIKQHMNDQNDKVRLKVMALEMKETVQELNIIASGLEISKKPEFILKYNSMRQPYNDLLKQIGDTASTPDQLKWRSQLIQASVDYINNFDSAAKMIQGNGTNPVDLQMNLLYIYNESQELKDKIFELVDHFYVAYSESADQAVSESTLLLDQTSHVMLVASVIVFICTVVIALLIIRSFLGPITRLQKAAASIADGDLSHTINSEAKDELGQLSRSFDHMIVQVREMLSAAGRIASSLTEHSHKFRQFSETTASANTDILKAIHEISVGADEQATHSEASSTMIAELEDEMNNITAYTQEMKRSSEEASKGTLKGTEAIKALKESSDSSQEVLKKVNHAMNTLAASSKQIGAITRSITEISTQTNVLALNAAIEAARAGVHGKGFSIIAEEVRQLSQQTNDSSKSISTIIQTLQTQISELQSSLMEAREQADSQTGRVAATIDSFSGIELSMNQITAQIVQVHGRIEQMRQKNDALVESVQFVAAVAQETAAGVEEVNSTSTQQDASIRQIAEEADDIYRLATQLFGEISKFKTGSEAFLASNNNANLKAASIEGNVKEDRKDDVIDKAILQGEAKKEALMREDMQTVENKIGQTVKEKEEETQEQEVHSASGDGSMGTKGKKEDSKTTKEDQEDKKLVHV
ncbi:methyl-accepting chemotaxis protein [Paenibacillus hexagrammi]|uniref:Methyl-accepting chemotaxis protein n=1 Tax=Paenibacillus hexagrammi TaxID=2908839 RepID=A0ABY3SE17_9BACL|nr:methyl-accepting chemotaxis protein [Paenibacillus sp. YPD9-1]UJF31710.1 methyl-accepting chemotaxis protein [Paenibacillus sp. YPD9-1]